jgi:hypothetical protein
MGGGLLQLVAYGAQDAYISGNPQITFFKTLYKRHTNFAMEAFRVNFNGQAAWGVKHSAVIGRHADLMYSTYLEVVLDSGNYNNDQGRLGYNLLHRVELEIGGQLIDRLYGEFMYLWDALSSDYLKSVKAFQMVGGGLSSGPVFAGGQSNCNAGSGRPGLPTILYIPLSFFYTKNPGVALPLIALQYHEVRINVIWNEVQNIAGDLDTTLVGSSSTVPQPLQAAVYVDYIYLDTEERRRMAQQSHEYLIEQTQFNEDKSLSSYSNRIDLTFNHPVKELIWVVQPSSYTNCNLAKGAGATSLKPFTYDRDAVYEQLLQINGQDRMDKRYGDYYNKVQPYQHHTGLAGTYQLAPTMTFPIQNNITGGATNVSVTLPFFVTVGERVRIKNSKAGNSGVYTVGIGSTTSVLLTTVLVLNTAGLNEETIPTLSTAGGGERVLVEFLDRQPNQLAYSQPGIYSYSFALKPEEHQPSGTCNFSRIDTAHLLITLSGDVVVSPDSDNTWDVRVYAINYNILRIMSGMGGLAYSN